MNKEIKLGDIKRYKDEYKRICKNKDLEEKIKDNGLKQACFNKDIEKNSKFKFNIQIPDVKTYDQKNSKECSIYAFLRVIKSIMKKDKSVNVRGLDLSATYIDFYDKLEKVNTFYNSLFKENNVTLDMINENADKYIGSFGTFNFCKKIISKYGLALSKSMPDVNDKYDADLVIELLKKKVKTDACVLINRNEENDEMLKDILISETYMFLSKVLGNPPESFRFNNEIITPLEFKNKYLKTSLDEYVTVTSYNKDLLTSSYSFIPSVYLKDDEEIITVTNKKLKEAVINQLKDGIGVWFSLEESTTLDYESNILDDNIYNFDEVLNIRKIPGDYKLKLNITNYDHAMCITGALIKDKEIKGFKVDNSFGKHGVQKGHLIMSNSFFENCCITFIINKKYLN